MSYVASGCRAPYPPAGSITSQAALVAPLASVVSPNAPAATAPRTALPRRTASGSAGRTTGQPMIAADRMVELITSAFEKDVPVHVHAIGDAAIRMTLDAIEASRDTTGKKSVTATIAHMDFVDAADIPRFAALGVTAQTSIQWAAQDPSYKNIGAFVGMQRMHDAYPVKSLIDAGALQTFGADQ